MRKRSLGIAAAWMLWAVALLPAGESPLPAGETPLPAGEPALRVQVVDAMLPVVVEQVVLVNGHPAVVLKNEEERKYLVVYVDQFMAQSIQMGMMGLSIERPLTHDLIGILLNRLGAGVNKVSITELRNNTYFAFITLRVNGSAQDIDSRPSDALALAVRLRAPIYVARELMRDTKFPEHGEEGEVTPEGPAGRKHGA